MPPPISVTELLTQRLSTFWHCDCPCCLPCLSWPSYSRPSLVARARAKKETHTHTPYLISSLTSLTVSSAFPPFSSFVGLPLPSGTETVATGPPACPCALRPFLPPPPAGLAGWLAGWRESWFYLFFCLFGKRAVAALGLAAALRCALLRAVGRQPCWPPRNVAGTPCAVFTPFQLLGSTGQSQACPVAPGEPWTHSVLSGRPHVAFGGTNPSLASDLL